MSLWRSHATVVGKAPWHPEFLRGAGMSPELYAFDKWLYDAAADGACPEPTSPGVWEARAYGFVVRLGDAAPGAPVAITGVLAPSHDRAGRAFPIAVATSLSIPTFIQRHAEVFPIALEPYWLSAGELLSDLRAATDATGVEPQRLATLTDGPLEPPEGAHVLYTQWTRGTAASEIARSLGRADGWLAETAYAVVDAVIAHVQNGPARPPVLGVRVPLGAAAGAELCFWLDVLRRAMRPTAVVPSFFWSHDGETGEALLYLDAPPQGALATLWGALATPLPVLDCTRASAARAEVDPVLGALEGADETVSQLLAGVDTRVSTFASRPGAGSR